MQEESKEFERLLEKEKVIDAEIKQEIDKYKLKQKRQGGGLAAGASSAAAAQQHALGVFGAQDDLIEIVDGNADPYASSDGEPNDADDRGDDPAAAGKDNEQYMEMGNEGEDPTVGGSSRRSTAGKLNSQRMQLLNQQLRVTV